MKRVFTILGVLIFAAVSIFLSLPASVSPVKANGDKFRKTDKSIPEQYIVVLEDWAVRGGEGRARVKEVTADLEAAYGGRAFFHYESAVFGFAVKMTEGRAIALSNDPRVKYVEEDGAVTRSSTQSSATWGLDRIDQASLPLNSTYNYYADGTGVRAYILDTGIRATHTDFGGRVVAGFTAINDGNGTNDCDGHGTHVAGTVGGTRWGVAKNVTLVPVRVLDCAGSGTWSGVIAGVDYVTAQKNSLGGPMVANMSLGGGAVSTLDTAVNNSVAAGVVHAVAAGNSNANACNYSPARAVSAITVGSTTSTDARSSFSNFGSCVDMFAPGSSISSAWYTGDTAAASLSGTSMASPHVAGAAALALQVYPTASAADITNLLKTNATPNKVTSAGTGSPNLLLYSAFLVVDGPDTPPTANFTFSCSGLTCSFNGSSSSDMQGSIQNYAWDFGDGTSGSGATTSKTFAAAGTYNVTLTVTDNGSQTGSTTKSVTVSNVNPISLSVVVSTKRGVKSAKLTWSGTSGRTDVFKNGTRVTTTTKTTYSDSLGSGTGSVSYRVCNAGSTTACSDTVTRSY
jgi:subtilisin family serine protease